MMENGLFTPGMPDGTFAWTKYQFGYNLEGLGIRNVGVFYGHFVYFTAIWYMHIF
jgi:hypothetical protein